MIRSNQTQSGFSFVAPIIILGLVVALAVASFFFLGKKSEDQQAVAESSTITKEKVESSPARIKHIGVDLDYYDAAANRAGDFVFTKDKLEFNRVFFEFGFTVPANSVGPEKRNPQPTFILPLGTKVHALVDGEVFDVPKLYSNDYSVMILGEGGDLIFEAEHVINVTVKKGDRVRAGDVIAEVSDYDAKNYSGLGLVEIGILKGGDNGPPKHLCPFDYLDESIREDTLNKVAGLLKSWEDYKGDSAIHDESATTVPGCMTLDPIEG